MDLQICLEKLQRVGVLNFATVDKDGAPQIRNISAIHYEKDGLYFFTARGKDFCGQLLHDGRVQILGYTKYKEMIRLSGWHTRWQRKSRGSGSTPYLRNSPIWQTYIPVRRERSALCLP